MVAWRPSLLVATLVVILQHATATNNQQTYGIYGAIQSIDKKSSISWLLEQCYAGFTLNSCQDLNATAGFEKDYSFATQFTDPVKQKQQFCLQCCTKPVPIAGADETWNLTCPLNDLQRLSVSQDRRVFRFARRNTLVDETVIECLMPPRSQATYLSGYELTLFIIERTSNFGASYWRSVVNCSVSISESSSPPVRVSEVIRVRSVPTPQDRPTRWILPTALAGVGLLGVMSIPIYNGKLRGQTCLHCGSWLVIVNKLCAICILVSCKLHPPPPKIYIDNGQPHSDKTAAADSDT